MSGLAASRPAAVVLGDIDLVRPLVLAGIAVAVITPPGDSARRSRYTTSIGLWDPTVSNDGLVDDLLAWGHGQLEHPVLYYQSDEQLLFLARHAPRLREVYRFVLDSRAPLLVDKGQFASLAASLELPVPASRTFHPGRDELTDALGDLPLPVILKPAQRADHLWVMVQRRPLRQSPESVGKAIVIRTKEELAGLWPRLVELDRPVVGQRYIPGPESMIESYHVYVAPDGIAAEFTGRKIRTLPAAYGHTTALTITCAPDVIDVGRRVVKALQLTGVAKLDFKRASDGTLHLLEVNPRFTLWHHAGARAGINIPALVYSDLTGSPRPSAISARAGRLLVQSQRPVRGATARLVPRPLDSVGSAVRGQVGLGTRRPVTFRGRIAAPVVIGGAAQH